MLFLCYNPLLNLIRWDYMKITYWYEVNIVDTILLIKVDNYEDFLKYSVGDKYPSLFCILSLLYQPSMNSNIASFVSS